MQLIQSSTKNIVRAKLILQGLSLRGFAKKHDYPYESVISAVNRYVGSEKEPVGRRTYEILTKLQEEIGTPDAAATENNPQ